MSDAIQAARAGLTRALAAFDAAAARVAEAGPQALSADPIPEDRLELSEQAVNLLQSKRAAEANVAVIRAADRLLGNLIDVLA